ncbi:deoxyribonuclease NucA/NucB-domain-containing protein [Daldinia caldariorum]|uniref:deoxyribonuclease NucA/NucB-domain-containing protein n=1 Tax=Daldinia caldariorum TaxID=326644 RepID=UPI0020089710|nr:deoxyribonuclease NucA/NucB-domain-containing protein [Daldinia caldariorum]KAI1469391.1 deoxyribonuclease NucA/NucB-domain-containing protein [Daldinia caldariorum]
MKASWILSIIAATPVALALGQESSLDSAELIIRATQKRVVTFDCDRMPEVCHNMCFAVHCKHKPKQLTWDKPLYDVERKRRLSAGCGQNNRCSEKKLKKKGYNCDEYPFATTKQADRGGQINRCVPRSENSRQGAILGQLYRSRGIYKKTGCNGRKNCSFTVAFKGSKTKTIGPCKTKPDCKADSNQWNKSGPLKREEPQRPQTVAEYKLRHSGDTITSSEDLQPGDLVYHIVERNATLAEKQFNDHIFDESAGLDQYDYMSDNMDIEEDEILDKI